MTTIPQDLVGQTLHRTNMQQKVLHQRKKARPAAVASGARTDAQWFREADQHDEKTNLDLLNAVEWMHARRGARFGAADRRTIACLANRSWQFNELIALHMRSLPAWLAEALPMRRSAGYHWMVAAVLGAYRAGAVGVWLSYGEAMAAFEVGSESTWRRWIVEMERLGLVRSIQTWMEDPNGDRPRVYGRTLYVAGSVIVDAIASLEGATQRGALNRDARSDSIERRKCAREEAKTRLKTIRKRRSAHDTPSLRPSAVLKKSATTPLDHFQNRNALPSFVGGDTTPPTVGDLKCATDAKASVAISSGESLGDSRTTPTMLADLLDRLGHGRSRQARALLDTHDKILGTKGQMASGEPMSGRSATGDAGGTVRPPPAGEIPLGGPIAGELWELFSKRRRTEH